MVSRFVCDGGIEIIEGGVEMIVDTIEFDGRCIECGSEELTEILEDGTIITICEDCGIRFIVAYDTNEAFDMDYKFDNY